MNMLQENIIKFAMELSGWKYKGGEVTLSTFKKGGVLWIT